MSKKYKMTVIFTLVISFLFKEIIIAGIFRLGYREGFLGSIFLSLILDVFLLTIVPSILLTIGVLVKSKKASIILSVISIVLAIPIMLVNVLVYFLATIEATGFEWWTSFINIIPIVFSVITIVKCCSKPKKG